MKTRIAFNATTQTEEEAIVTIDRNGEYLFTFSNGAFFKLPSDFTKEQINKALDDLKTANEGQLLQEVIDQENEEKLDNV